VVGARLAPPPRAASINPVDALRSE
jgi:hypothetical protein